MDRLNEILLRLYKVKYRHTANKYVAVHGYRSEAEIIDMVRRADDRCDDIIGIEIVPLEAFDQSPDGKTRYTDYISVFYDLNIG